MIIAPTIVQKSKYCIDSPLGSIVKASEDTFLTIWKRVQQINPISRPEIPLLFSAVALVAFPSSIGLYIITGIFLVYVALLEEAFKHPIAKVNGQYWIKNRDFQSINPVKVKEVIAELSSKPFFQHWLSAKNLTVAQAEKHFEKELLKGTCYGHSCARLSQLAAGGALDNTPDEKKVYLHQILHLIDIYQLNTGPRHISLASQQQIDDVKECQDLLYKIADPARVKLSHYHNLWYNSFYNIDSDLKLAWDKFFPYEQKRIISGDSTFYEGAQLQYENVLNAQKVDLDWNKHYLCGLIGGFDHAIAFNIERDAVFVYDVQKGYSKVPPQNFCEFIVNEVRSYSKEKCINIDLFLVEKLSSWWGN